jgi:Arc/MetJ family transcription regulator
MRRLRASPRSANFHHSWGRNPDTLKATGLKTKREAVELGLRTLLRLGQQAEIRQFRGRLTWTGNLDAMRTDG